MSRARIASGRAADERKDSGHIRPHHGGPQSVQGSGLMRVAAAGDSCLLLGGDLIVTTCQVSSCPAVAITATHHSTSSTCIYFESLLLWSTQGQSVNPG